MTEHLVKIEYSPGLVRLLVEIAHSLTVHYFGANSSGVSIFDGVVKSV